MQLDVPTLAVVTVFVTALLGGLLLFAGMHNRAGRAPMLWGVSFLLGAFGMALVVMRGQIPDWLSIQVANAVVLLGMALVWAGTRMFEGRTVRPGLVLAMPLAWIACSLIPSFATDVNLRTVVASAMLSLLSCLAAWEIWAGRAEPLLSRWPTIITLLSYGAALLARIPATILVPQLHGSQQLIMGAMFPVVAFGTLMFTVILAFLLLNMSKERTELQHKTASLIDPLSGVSNRRAFLDGAERLLRQQRLRYEPLALILFDLDHFKSINDRLGHAAGDDVLKVFAREAAFSLGPDVLFGRIGGEEFAALLSVTDIGEAIAIGDRVRRNFAAVAAGHCAGVVVPTVSVGVALGGEPDQPIAGLMAAADRALYRAKANGRNRVDICPLETLDASAESTLVPVQREQREWRGKAAVG